MSFGLETRPIEGTDHPSIYAGEAVGTLYKCKASILLTTDRTVDVHQEIHLADYEVTTNSGRDDDAVVKEVFNQAWSDGGNDTLDGVKLAMQLNAKGYKIIGLRIQFQVFTLPDGFFVDGFVVQKPAMDSFDKTPYILLAQQDFDQ